MGENLAWFFDIAIIGILLVFIYNGGKKGFIKTVIVLIGYFAALFGGYIVSKSISPFIYEKTVQSSVEKAVLENIDKIDIKSQINSIIQQQNVGVSFSDEEIGNIINNGGDLATGFASYAKEKGSTLDTSQLQDKFKNVFAENTILSSLNGIVPEDILKNIQMFLSSGGDNINKIIVALNNPSQEQRAKDLTEVAIKPIIVLIIQIIVFIIAFSILMIVVRMLSNIITKTLKIVPVVGPINTFLGGVLGLLQGLIIIFIIMLIIKLIISITNNETMLFNNTTIEQTYIFKHIYNLKLF